jgi:hypothetical protein
MILSSSLHYVIFTENIGTSFSKFKGMLMFVLQMFPADNIKGFEMQAATKCWHEKHKEQMESYNVFTSVCHS